MQGSPLDVSIWRLQTSEGSILDVRICDAGQALNQKRVNVSCFPELEYANNEHSFPSTAT